jgi:hypothetical protein
MHRAGNLDTFMSLNLLKPHGPVQACTGISLPSAFNLKMESENSSETNLCQSGVKTSNQISFFRTEFERKPD